MNNTQYHGPFCHQQNHQCTVSNHSSSGKQCHYLLIKCQWNQGQTYLRDCKYSQVNCHIILIVSPFHTEADRLHKQMLHFHQNPSPFSCMKSLPRKNLPQKEQMMWLFWKGTIPSLQCSSAHFLGPCIQI